MANGNAYPAVMLDPDGQTDSAAVTLQFTDSTDQPAAGDGGAFAGWSEDTSNPANVSSNGGGLDLGGGNLQNAGVITGQSLGSTFPYVTVQSAPPDTTYITPLVYDNTIVTGGLYAWDGSAYQQVGNVVS